MKQRRKLVLAALAIVIILGIIQSRLCIRTWVQYGVHIDRCPSGELRQTLSIDGWNLRRGSQGTVQVSAWANYSPGPSDVVLQTPMPRFEPTLSLLDKAGKTHALKLDTEWKAAGDARTRDLTLPDLPDGDYVLRAAVKSRLGEGSIDLPLALYAPARIHVITDRPLYEPGNTVQFRAVVLRARDLSPLDGRPGTWFVQDPNGEVLLEERAPAGDWGVVAGSFPLDSGATSGDWRVRWVSGGTSDEVSFKVEPFTLPRFRVEVEPSAPYYVSSQRPKLRGSVTYSSGAPVAAASVELKWSVSGDWPPPSDWIDGLLPKSATTDKAGHFNLELPAVPADLRGQATLSAHLSAVDSAGDRVEGRTSVLLTEDQIQVSAVTELAEGLVENYNNRIYLRAVSASGKVLSGVDLTVKRAWEPRDKGIATKTDEDGVAALQLDPGPAVNVVIPPMPWRPPPREKRVRRGATHDLVSDQEPSLADQIAMDRWIAGLEPCARFLASGSRQLIVALRADPAGRVIAVGRDTDPLANCLAKKLDGSHLSAGKDRLLSMELTVTAGDLPQITVNVDGAPAVPDAVRAAIEEAVLDARSCLPETIDESEVARVLTWKTQAASRSVLLGWVTGPREGDARALSASVMSCIESHLKTARLAEDAELEALGVAKLHVQPSARAAQQRPQAMTMLGYELAISARAGNEDLGKTRLRMSPGAVPPVRLRAQPVLAAAGKPVTVEILRGPGFTAKLPETLWLQHEVGGSIEAKLDEKSRSAQWTLPGDAKGWYEVNWSGARALIYVRPSGDLDLAIAAEKTRYKPGETANLRIATKTGGVGGPAAVGLIGVDESLGQLVPLPGADDLSRLRPKIVTPSPAFGVLDGQALSMGRIRGANAAAATVIRVSQIPTPPDLDVAVSASNAGRFDALEPLTDHFYVALGELHAQVRVWEDQAPKDELMHPPTMARLWGEALAACAKRGQPVDDAFGRPLKLSGLPPDLLALTDPRAVVVRGTRLPEDVEDWANWVRKERP